mmetsp:Transcript_42938/g.113352  ORF Transcript_42938/g.113352 Transcript_42938/m.113352 type:complete len:256 (+) Transcript_42938:638-1405(+)
MHIVTNTTGAISKSPVYVRVVRPTGITMTMCDLPGITSLSAVQRNIEEATTELTAEWAANKGMVLLCAVPASEDFHNSKALKIALQHDPHGLRTIGVVTKCDLLPARGDFCARMRMDRAADVRLEAHGFIALRNRTQEESDRGATDDELRAAERALFTSHPQLRDLPRQMWGLCARLRRSNRMGRLRRRTTPATPPPARLPADRHGSSLTRLAPFGAQRHPRRQAAGAAGAPPRRDAPAALQRAARRGGPCRGSA